MSSAVRMVFILILVIVILAAGWSFWYINQSLNTNAPSEPSAQAEAEESETKRASYKDLEELVFPTEQVLTNLNSGNVVRVSFTLLVDDPEVIEELAVRRFQLNSEIIALLHSKEPGDLTGEDGQKNLQKEIQGRINSLLESGEVVEVYTQEMILQ